MADRLASKLISAGLAPVWPVEANLVFIALPRMLDVQLRAAGAQYYGGPSASLNLGDDKILARLVTFFATRKDEVDHFARLCSRLAAYNVLGAAVT
jgi:threonine aldolase